MGMNAGVSVARLREGLHKSPERVLGIGLIA